MHSTGPGPRRRGPDGDEEGHARVGPGPRGNARRLRDLRGKIRSHPLIAQAQGVLPERYRLRGPSAPFDLLRDTSQRHNIRVRAPVGAVLTAPRPRTGTRASCPAHPGPGPALGFLADVRVDRINRSTVITALPDRAVEVTDTYMGPAPPSRHRPGVNRRRAHGRLCRRGAGCVRFGA